MKKYLYTVLVLIGSLSSHAGFFDDINHPDAPGGVIKNAHEIAKDPLFQCVGTIFSGPLERGVRFISSAVLISSTMALSTKHSFEAWTEERPTHQFYFGFPEDPSNTGVDPERFRIVSKLIGFKDQDIVLIYLDKPIMNVTPASIIGKEEYIEFLGKISSSSLTTPLPALKDERTCGIFAGHSAGQTGSILQKMSVTDVDSFFSTADRGGPKAAGAIQLRHYDKTQSLLVSTFVDFCAEGRQEPLLFKKFKASAASLIPGDSGSGVFFEIAGKWKLVAIATSTKASNHALTELMPGLHMLFSYWSPLRLSPERLEKAIAVLEKKPPLFARA